jgi:hypothetical protein
MASAQPLNVPDAIPRHMQPILRNNATPLSVGRVLLKATLPRDSADESRAQLRALFHSPVGIYVAGMEFGRDKVNVHFDIAPGNLDFMVHTLIVTLPQAMIGPVERRPVTINAH